MIRFLVPWSACPMDERSRREWRDRLFLSGSPLTRSAWPDLASREATAHKLIGTTWGDDGSTRIQHARTTDPDLIRRLHVGQACYITHGSATFVQVARPRPSPLTLLPAPGQPGPPPGCPSPAANPPPGVVQQMLRRQKLRASCWPLGGACDRIRVAGNRPGSADSVSLGACNRTTVHG